MTETCLCTATDEVMMERDDRRNDDGARMSRLRDVLAVAHLRRRGTLCSDIWPVTREYWAFAGGSAGGMYFLRQLRLWQFLAFTVFVIAGCASPSGVLPPNSLRGQIGQELSSPSAGGPDANSVDASGVDANGADANKADANRADANRADANRADANSPGRTPPGRVGLLCCESSMDVLAEPAHWRPSSRRMGSDLKAATAEADGEDVRSEGAGNPTAVATPGSLAAFPVRPFGGGLLVGPTALLISSGLPRGPPIAI